MKHIIWTLPSKRRSRIIDCFVVMLLAVTFFLPKPVFAHILATDGSIGAVLHIDPEDDPIAGETAGFFFEFKDKTGKFKPENCECTFAIVQGGKELYTQPLFQNSSDPGLTNANATYTFPEKNVYQVKVEGKPSVAEIFQSFILTYDIRVDRGLTQPETPKNSSGLPLLALMGGGLLLFFVILFLVKKHSAKGNPITTFLLLLLFVTLYVYPTHLFLPHHHNNYFSDDSHNYPCSLAYTNNPTPTFVFKTTFQEVEKTVSSSPTIHSLTDSSSIRIRSPPTIFS